MMKIRKADHINGVAVEQLPSAEINLGEIALESPLRQTRQKLAATIQEQPLSPLQENIWEQATAYCIRNLPTLWTAGEPRCESSQGCWIVPIVICYPDGFEGSLGEMAFDEQTQEFTLLTERDILSERARAIAATRSST